MHIKIRLYASLRKDHAPEEHVEVPVGTTIMSLIEMLGVDAPTVTLVFINGRHADFLTEIHDGDEIALFPPIGGG
jgi:sulfur-carrier protein